MSSGHSTTQKSARNDHVAGTITHFHDGFHIIWKGNKKGRDCLHDSAGHRYCVYSQPNSQFTRATDSEAFWWCTGQLKQDKGSPSKRCTLMIHEVDGVFTSVPGRNHHVGNHGPSPNSIKDCPACSLVHNQKNVKWKMVCHTVFLCLSCSI